MQFNNFKKLAALFLLAAVVCSLFAGCSDKSPKPEDTIEMLEKSINNFDVDGIMACIDEDWASQVDKVLSFSVGEKGMSIGSYITLLKTDITDETAVVALSGILVWGEFTKPFAATVDMELQNETWVVCSIR